MSMPQLLPAWLARWQAALHVRLRRRRQAPVCDRTVATPRRGGARVRCVLAPLSVPASPPPTSRATAESVGHP